MMNALTAPAPPARTSDTTSPPLLRVIILSALAGGMGWGIRGQYGHETGAMIAGLLVGFVLVLLFRPFASSLQAARAVALCAAAIGFGGAMTYGQTVGLTHNSQMVGNWSALGWGMLGLGIKGALWIGFAGVFLGMGLSGIRYRPIEMAGLIAGMLLLMVIGMWALNSPFDPANRQLPRFYFSADWYFYPDAGPELKPRREFWGGFLFALVGLVIYVGAFRKDVLARNMAFWGCLGGLGFPIGQCLQAWHAWNLHLFKDGPWAQWDKIINWWNFMETTFGLVLGACLGLGLWLNRRRIALMAGPGEVTMKPALEFGLLAMHLPLLFLWEFASFDTLDAVGDLGIPRSAIPLICVVGGRYWPYLMSLPVIALPIAGKTGKDLGWDPINSAMGVGLWVVLPVVLLGIVALYFARRSRSEPPPPGHTWLVPGLLIAAWFYYCVNYTFFKFPWPWATWTARTPNAIVYTVCVLALTWLAWRGWRWHGDRRKSK